MRKKLLPGIFVLAVLLIAGFGMKRSMNSYGDLSDMALKNVIALADGEDPGDGEDGEDPNPGEDDEGEEKIFRYETWSNRECYVFVGGAYAKGKEVTCWPGSDHPVCVVCQL